MELPDADFSLEYDGIDFSIPLADDIHLRGQEWRPPQPPTFIVVFIHGLGSFATFRRDYFHVITARGGAAFACDHLGHGRSPGVRVSCTIDDIVEETMKVMEFAHTTYPTLPLTLHGHSLGGLVAVVVALRHEATLASLNLRSVIIESPWLFPSPAINVSLFQRWSLRPISLVNPNFQIPRGATTITDDLDPRWTTLIRAVQGTPTYPDYITAKLALSGVGAQHFVQENALRWPPDIPLLLVQGGKDTAVGVDGALRWIRQVSEIEGASVTYRVWPEATHFLMMLPCRNEVLNEIFGFIGR